MYIYICVYILICIGLFHKLLFLYIYMYIYIGVFKNFFPDTSGLKWLSNYLSQQPNCSRR